MYKFFSKLLYRKKESLRGKSQIRKELERYWRNATLGHKTKLIQLDFSDLSETTKSEIEQLQITINEIRQRLTTLELKIDSKVKNENNQMSA